jgi:uncharacterized repeat protein (TIGR01451 family)
MSLGLALMLLAGVVAFGVAEPARQDRMSEAAKEQTGAKVIAAGEMSLAQTDCTYPYGPTGECNEADLQVAKDSVPATIDLNTTTAFSYKVVVTNAGPDVATNVKLVDSLPSGAQVVSVPAGCNAAAPDTGNPTWTVECTTASLAVNSSFEVVIVVKYAGPDVPVNTVTNTATATSDDTDPVAGNSSDTATTTVQGRSASLVDSRKGYWLAAKDGGVFAFGAPFLGSMGGINLVQQIVGMAPTLSGSGYWLVAADGGIFSFGDAVFHGSTGSVRLNQPIAAMAVTPSGKGYWLVASDGGVFAFGDAKYSGSTGNIKLNKPVVAMAPTPTGNGYILIASDGGVFAFGDAKYQGSMGAVKLVKPVVGGQATSGGYYMVASDGGIFTFGNAPFHGSTGAIKLVQPIIGMAALPVSVGGYWLGASDGGVFAFGGASYNGSLGNISLAQPIVAIAGRVPSFLP